MGQPWQWFRVSPTTSPDRGDRWWNQTTVNPRTFPSDTKAGLECVIIKCWPLLTNWLKVPFPSYPGPGNVEFKGAVWQCNMRNLAALETLSLEFIVTGRSVLSPSHGSHDVSLSTVSTCLGGGKISFLEGPSHSESKKKLADTAAQRNMEVGYMGRNGQTFVKARM